MYLLNAGKYDNFKSKTAAVPQRRQMLSYRTKYKLTK